MIQKIVRVALKIYEIIRGQITLKIALGRPPLKSNTDTIMPSQTSGGVDF